MTSVAIIGGYGGMGKLFAGVLKKHGLDVTLAGPRPEKGAKVAKELGVSFEQDNKTAVSDADIVIVTVPIRKTLAVIDEIAPELKDGSLLMDFTSVKKEPCAVMAKLAPKSVEVVGCHPVFGPSVKNFKGQNFVFCPIRKSKTGTKGAGTLHPKGEGKNFLLFKKIVEKEGASVVECTPEEHDRAMGIVQGMTHFMLISAGMTMKDLDFDLKKTEGFSSPVYTLVFDMVGRILAQDPSLYAEIQLNNSEAEGARKAFLKAAERLDGIIKKGDEDAFVEEMEKAAKQFGDTQGSLKRTNELLK